MLKNLYSRPKIVSDTQENQAHGATYEKTRSTLVVSVPTKTRLVTYLLFFFITLKPRVE